jgi:methionine synthase I (cobalamin-dependent)
MRPSFRDALFSGKILLMDGAMGTELIRRGLDSNKELPPQWNLSRPEVVQEVHEAYVAAGAVCLVTNTFTAHLRDEQQTIVDAALRLARRAAGKDCFVFGAIGPGSAADGLRLAQLLTTCDALLFETQFVPATITEVLNGWRNDASVPVLVSFAFARGEKDYFCPGAGNARHSVEELAGWAERNKARLTALGVNCGLDLGIEDVVTMVRRYRQITDLAILARPNAGSPPRESQEWVSRLSPEKMAAGVRDLVAAGATLIGGCCGTTPAHIDAMRDVLDRLGLLWKPDHQS